MTAEAVSITNFYTPAFMPSDLERQVQSVLESFIQALVEDGHANLPHDVFIEGRSIEGREIRKHPEEFTEDNLIWPLLRALGHEHKKRPLAKGFAQGGPTSR